MTTQRNQGSWILVTSIGAQGAPVEEALQACQGSEVEQE